MSEPELKIGQQVWIRGIVTDIQVSFDERAVRVLLTHERLFTREAYVPRGLIVPAKGDWHPEEEASK